MITLSQAKTVIEHLRPHLMPHVKEIEFCGSYRRKKRFVNDIDIVMIEREDYEFGSPTLSQTIQKLDPAGIQESKAIGKSGVSRFLDGPAIKRFKFEGIMIDIYMATPQNYSCLKLIRTGSANHNIKLTTLAKQQGLKLFAGGEGLCRTTLNNGKELIVETVQTQEDEILKHLLGTVPTPEQREV